MTQTFQPIINIHPPPAPTAEPGSDSHISPDWEVRYPGGIADVSMLSGPDRRLQRFAIGEDFTFINNSPHQVSLGVTFLIGYGTIQLATDPYSLPLGEWGQLLTAFGITNKPQLQFPLNLQPRSAIEGHIVFSIRPDGAGRGVGGDVPGQRRYLFEFEDLLSKQKVIRTASAVIALDKDNHQRYYQTDLARPGPKAEPFIISADPPISKGTATKQPSLAVDTPAVSVNTDRARQIRRLKTEWELNQNNVPGMFERATDILGALHRVTVDFYAEIMEGPNQTSTTLVRSALEHIAYLDNLPISHSTDIPAYWRGGNDVFDLLRRAQECLTSKVG